MLTRENGFTLPLKWKFPEAKRYAFCFIALLLAVLIIYSNSFHGDWHFDDFFNIIENPNVHMKSFSVDSIKHCIYALSPDRPSRPLSYFSFGLNYYFGQTDVFGYHMVNVVIHYLAALFLFLFLYNTLKLPLIRDEYANMAYPIALLASFFWAVHPIHVTSITYVVQRMASMAGMFYILSMYFYLKARTSEKKAYSIGFFSGSALAGLAAILSKENAAMLPVSILLFDLFLIQGINKKSIINILKIIILPFVMIVFFGLMYTGSLSLAFGGYEMRDFTMGERVLTEPRVILFYLSLLFYPIYSRLTLLYDMDISHSLIQPWTTMPAIGLIILLIGFAFYIARKRPLLSFCIIFYFLNHLIEGSIFNLELIYEHRNYLPSMLLFVPVAQFIIFIMDYFSYKKVIQFVIMAGVVIILVGEGDITYRRNTTVSSQFLLWLDNIEKYPGISRPYSNLGTSYMLHQQKDKGLLNYEKAMALDNFANTHVRALQEHNLGVYYFLEEKYDKALPYFEKAAQTIPVFLPNAVYLAKTYLLRDELSRAHRLIEPLINKYPGNYALNEIFCLILLKENDIAAAELYAKRYLKTDPAHKFPYPVLAEIARRRGNLRSATTFWQIYLEMAPQDIFANLALIELYDETNSAEKLDQEINKLYYFKGNRTLASYLKDVSRKQKLFVYSPDAVKIETIAQENIICP